MNWVKHGPRGWILTVFLVLWVSYSASAEGGGPFARRAARRVATPTSFDYANANAPSPMLGTFYPDNYMVVRGNAPAGGGYSPLGIYGDRSLSIYGPLSSMRATAAPLLTYTRGYDGQLYPTMGTAFSYPNLPAVGPVIYPTQASFYYGFRESRTPPWWKSGINWIDQN